MTTATGSSIAERFARETAQHQMTVLHDDGLYRHLRFRAPTHGTYWFDLITVPGTLIFQGDGESYVFSRVEDMFKFFRSPVGQINPGYWSQKLTSHRPDGVRVWDEQIFKTRVIEEFVDAARYPGATLKNGRVLPGGVPPGTGKALREQVLDPEVIYHEDEARQRLAEFEHKGFRFSDTWEWDFRDYDWWFLWALHGIVWGIAQYDKGVNGQ